MNYVACLVLCVLAIFIFTEIIFINKREQDVVLVQYDSVLYHRPDKTNYANTILQSDNLVQLAQKNKNVPIELTEYQLPPYPPNMTATDGNWQTVNGTQLKFYVFSAFVDRRKVKKLVIHESHYKAYSASFVLCPLQANQTTPTTVSIVAKVLEPPANLLIVNDNAMYNHTIPNTKFGICLEPMHSGYNGTMRLLEFLELNRILGVSHITSYNQSIGPQADCILKYYLAQGFITILPWKLNMTSRDEIWTKGLFAAFNDCLYRSMYQFSHIVVIDIDEYIISRRNHSIPRLINYLGTTNNRKKIGSYNFRNAFFYLPWEDDKWVNNSNNLVATNLFTLKKTRRKARFYPDRIRSKYIYRPEVVVEVGNHFVWEFIPGYRAYHVPIDTAILHHYRERCEREDLGCLSKESTIDTTALRYHNSLVRAVTKQYLRLKQKCDLEDLHFPVKQKG